MVLLPHNGLSLSQIAIILLLYYNYWEDAALKFSPDAPPSVCNRYTTRIDISFAYMLEENDSNSNKTVFLHWTDCHLIIAELRIYNCNGVITWCCVQIIKNVSR